MKSIIILIILPVTVLGNLEMKNGKLAPFKLEAQKMVEFIENYAKVTKRPILYGPNHIRGEVNFVSTRPMAMKDLDELFSTVLSSQGLTLLKNDGFYRIIEERDVRYTATEFYSQRPFPDTTDHILVKHELEHPVGASLIRAMRPYLSRYGRIVSLSDGHTILISERGSNVKRIISLIDSLDNKIDLKRFTEEEKHRKEKQIKERSKINVEAIQLDNEMMGQQIKALEAKLKKGANK